jgi:phage tail-like protein
VSRRKTDPYPSFNFVVTLLGSSRDLLSVLRDILGARKAGFSECSGLEGTLSTEDYEEGGNNGRTLHFPTRMTWSNIRLKRGLGLSDDLWEWHWEFVEGHGKRRDGLIILNDERQDAVKAWQFYRGIPIKWTGPAFNAAQSENAIEELEIAHEGLEQIPV